MPACSSGSLALAKLDELTRLILILVLSRYVITHRAQNLQLDSSAVIASAASGLISILALEFSLFIDRVPASAISRRWTMCSSISERSFRIVCHFIAIFWSSSARRSRQG